MFKKLFKKQKGFTLLELIIATLVLGMLTGLAIPAYTSWTKEAQVSSMIQEIDSLEKASEVYVLENNTPPIGEVYTLEDGPFKNAVLQQEDGNGLYLLDTEVLADKMTSLKYGSNVDNDVYVYSTDTKNIYYAGGFENADGVAMYSAVPESTVTNVMAGDVFMEPDDISFVADAEVTITGYVDKDEIIEITLNDEPVAVTIGNTLVASPEYQKHYFEFISDMILSEEQINEIKITTSTSVVAYSAIVGTDMVDNSIVENLGPFKQIATGSEHTIVLMEDGSVRSFGNNYSGQLGDNTNDDRHIPVNIGLSNVKAIACGNYYTVAVMEDGSVKSFGDNSYGQLGDGTTTSKNHPIDIGLDGARSVDCGMLHTIVLMEDGSVKSFGYNGSGQLGDGTTVERHSPVDIGLDGARSVDCGMLHTIVLMEDGSLKAWGYNHYGQLGDSTTVNKYSPTFIGLNGVKSIACGDYHTIALLEDKSVRSFGRNNVGQLGDGTVIDKHSPVENGLNSAKLVACGRYHTMVLMEDGSVKSFGKNSYGQLGDNTTSDKHTPIVIGLNGVESIACGEYFSIALMEDGSVKSFGRNNHGQLGDDTTTDRYTPVDTIGLE